MSHAIDSSPVEYALSRNTNASIRLNFQHWILQSTFGYRLHPNIEIPPNATIADVGCGTGIWLVELSQEAGLKQASFNGFDIDLSQVPARGALFPKNISFQELDIVQPLPEHLEGKFDLVNLRLFCLVLGGGGPRFDLVLKNLIKMIKPGGWLQWSEYDRTNAKVAKAFETSTTTAIEKAFDLDVDDIRVRIGDWVPQLEEHFARARLTATAFDRRWMPPHLLGMQQLNMLAGFDELTVALPEGDAYKKRLQGNQSALYEDVKSGGYYSALLVLAIGKKPLE